jgi:hypothetical protein
VEKGIVNYNVTNSSLKAIVLSEGWPSFTMVLESSGFQVDTYIDQKLEFEELILGKVCKNSPKLMTSFNCPIRNMYTSNTSVWIQGTTEFISKMNEIVGDYFTSVTCVISNPTRKYSEIAKHHKSSVSSILSHSNVGGLTLGRWAYSVPKEVDIQNINRVTPVQRQLKHIMDFTQKGIPYVHSTIQTNKRKLNKEKFYSETSRVLPGELKPKVITHSVMQPSIPRIKRFLTHRELLDIYDVQTDRQSIILGEEKSTQVEILKSLIIAAPEKLLHRIVTAVKKHLSIANVSSDPKSNDQSNNIDKMKWIKETGSGDLNDEKAARNDDAAIETEQWDWYLLRNYNPQLQLDCISKYIDITKRWEESSKLRPIVCHKNSTPTENHTKLFENLRRLMSAKFSQNVFRSFSKFMKEKYGKLNYINCVQTFNSCQGNKRSNGLRKILKDQRLSMEFIRDFETGTEAVKRACRSTFWDWDGGSSLFFWRWPDAFTQEARDGTPVFVNGKLPRYKVSQRWPRDKAMREKMEKKWENIITREYVKPGPVVSLTGSFPVAKGESDIRMVYDASKCGLNSQLWAPNFMLPTIDMTLRNVDHKGWFGDIDLGEMFLNFPLDTKLRPYAGIDATALRESLKEIDSMPRELLESKGRFFMRWERCLMGLRSSPFNACKAMAWADDIIRGNRFDPNNAFRWDRYLLNLPGTKDYDPALPRGYKWNDKNNSIAGNFEIYIDDIRSSNSSEEGCVLASRRIASICNFLGIQDAARKRHFPSQTPRVWCGAKSATDNKGLYTCTTQAKWDRGKNIINSWVEELALNKNTIDRKGMMSGRGFLVHLSRTYPGIVPFLKGVHHTLESWRKGRNKDGWKYSRDEWRMFLGEVVENKAGFEQALQSYLEEGDKDAPARVKGVNRLQRDLTSLQHIMKSPSPPLRLIRGQQLSYVLYGFGDASGAGFGSSWENKDGLCYRFGVWGKDAQGRSSNYRELRNLVESLEEMGKSNNLSGTEIHFFTDNSTAETAYFKGSSTSELLHELVTRLRALEMEAGCKVILVHVSGERMKWQGTDGLSRGNLLEGVMKGENMLTYVPLHLPALERSPKLLAWIRSWIEIEEGLKLEVLKPEDWFCRGHDLDKGKVSHVGLYYPTYKSGIFLWQPPPGAADIACEEIRKARTKRTSSTHIFICPRLLTPYWRAHLHRSADLLFEIPAGGDYWPKGMFEPLILAIFFPFIPHRPWQLRHTPSLVEVGDRMQRMWKERNYSQGFVLRQLWKQTRSMGDLSPSVVFKMLHCFGELGVSCQGGKKRSRGNLEEEKGRGKVHDCKRR